MDGRKEGKIKEQKKRNREGWFDLEKLSIFRKSEKHQLRIGGKEYRT